MPRLQKDNKNQSIKHEYFRDECSLQFPFPDMPLAILEQGYDRLATGDDTGLYRHEDFYALYVIQSGRGIHDIDGHPYSLKRGDVYFTLPGSTHAYRDYSDFRAEVFSFQTEFRFGSVLSFRRNTGAGSGGSRDRENGGENRSRTNLQTADLSSRGVKNGGFRYWHEEVRSSSAPKYLTLEPPTNWLAEITRSIASPDELIPRSRTATVEGVRFTDLPEELQNRLRQNIQYKASMSILRDSSKSLNQREMLHALDGAVLHIEQPTGENYLQITNPVTKRKAAPTAVPSLPEVTLRSASGTEIAKLPFVPFIMQRENGRLTFKPNLPAPPENRLEEGDE